MSPAEPSSPPPVPPASSASGEGEKKSRSGCLIAAVVVGILVAVFVVVGILAGLMFPAVSAAAKKAKVAHAMNNAHNLRNSIGAFFTEYRRYPMLETSDDTLETEGLLVAILVADSGNKEAVSENPRLIAFFAGAAARPHGEGGWKQGLNLDPEHPGIYDPWGNPYRIAMDADRNRRIENPAGGEDLRESVLVFSAGPDGDFGTWEDNITTW